MTRKGPRPTAPPQEDNRDLEAAVAAVALAKQFGLWRTLFDLTRTFRGVDGGKVDWCAVLERMHIEVDRMHRPTTRLGLRLLALA